MYERNTQPEPEAYEKRCSKRGYGKRGCGKRESVEERDAGNKSFLFVFTFLKYILFYILCMNAIHNQNQRLTRNAAANEVMVNGVVVNENLWKNVMQVTNHFYLFLHF